MKSTFRQPFPGQKRVRGLGNRIELFLIMPLIGITRWMTVPWHGRWTGKLPKKWSWAEGVLTFLYMVDVKLQEIFWGEQGETITNQFRESDKWWVTAFVRHFSTHPEDHFPEDDPQG